MPTVSLLELFLRASAVYLGILVAMRVLRRQKGGLNAADLLVLIIVADAAQNAMSSDYSSLTEGAVLVGAVFFWDYALDALSFRYESIRKLLNAEPLLLIQDGELQRKNLRAEMLTVDDVMEQLREQGIDNLRAVKKCCLEADGHFSVIRVDGGEGQRPAHAIGGAG